MWEPVAELTLTMALMVQCLSLLIVAVYTEDALSNKQDVIRTYKDDEGVKALEEAEAAKEAETKAAVAMGRLGGGARFLLVTGALSVTVTSYILFGAMELFFYNFQLGQDKVQDVMCMSCDKAIITPMGWYAVGFLAYGIFSYMVFTSCVAPAMSAAHKREHERELL